MHLVHRVDGRKRIGRIVETEAYLGPRDLAAHSARGRTERNAVMFGPLGDASSLFHLRHLALLRTSSRAPRAYAGGPHPGAGTEAHLEQRTWGPGLLCRSMGIDRSQNGVDLTGNELSIEAPVRPARLRDGPRSPGSAWTTRGTGPASPGASLTGIPHTFQLSPQRRAAKGRWHAPSDSGKIPVFSISSGCQTGLREVHLPPHAAGPRPLFLSQALGGPLRAGAVAAHVARGNGRARAGTAATSSWSPAMRMSIIPASAWPSSAALLEAQGFRVGIIAQPDWRSRARFARLGQPNLFFGITAGNMDSMVNRYTADRRIRSDDAYTPGGEGGKRPDRSVIVYAQRAPRSLRRCAGRHRRHRGQPAAHRAFRLLVGKVRRSILLDAKADLLVYGNAERQIVEIAHRLAKGEPSKTSPTFAAPHLLARHSGRVDGDRFHDAGCTRSAESADRSVRSEGCAFEGGEAAAVQTPEQPSPAASALPRAETRAKCG